MLSQKLILTMDTQKLYEKNGFSFGTTLHKK